MALRIFSSPGREFFPTSTDFDHLYSEYRALDPPVPDNDDKKRLDEIAARRRGEPTPSKDSTQEDELSWSDIYTFELILLKYLPLASLRNKVISLRDKYLNVFGQDKLRAYLDTKPTDPKEPIPDPPANTTDPVAFRDAKEKDLAERLRADCKFLLDQLYLSYAALNSREGLGKWLTKWAAYILSTSVFVLLLLLVLSILIQKYTQFQLPGMPFIVAGFAGAVGGLVSILQRLQTVPTGGDPIYSLETFWNGAYSLFVSPLTGAIFGILIYLIFAGNVMSGRFFPAIFTPGSGNSTADCASLPSPTPSPSPTSSPSAQGQTASQNTNTAATSTNTNATTTNTNANTTTASTNSNSNTISNANRPPSNSHATPSPSAGAAATPSPAISPSQTPTPSPSPSPTPTPIGSTSFGRFLRCSGPGSGLDYALLILWCFIAGFAERLVPDTLNRLVEETTTTKKT